MLKKVILCPNPYRDHELTVAKEAKRILDSVHCPNVVCVPFRNEEKPEGYGLDIRPLQQELRGADMIIAFGGDGTILHLSKTAAHRDIPVLGVNLGSLGFTVGNEPFQKHARYYRDALVRANYRNIPLGVEPDPTFLNEFIGCLIAGRPFPYRNRAMAAAELFRSKGLIPPQEESPRRLG